MLMRFMANIVVKKRPRQSSFGDCNYVAPRDIKSQKSLLSLNLIIYRSWSMTETSFDKVSFSEQ